VEDLHTISGTCDLCGEGCDANTQELNVLSCTFKNCEDLPYHQDCLEKVRGSGAATALPCRCCALCWPQDASLRSSSSSCCSSGRTSSRDARHTHHTPRCQQQYLKSIRLERNRKTGFKCPRGCGKGTRCAQGVDVG
jgi:hypothetical protein